MFHITIVGTGAKEQLRLANEEAAKTLGNILPTYHEAKTKANLHQELAPQLLELIRELEKTRRKNR